MTLHQDANGRVSLILMPSNDEQFWPVIARLDWSHTGDDEMASPPSSTGRLISSPKIRSCTR
jgi:hypothetical protein